ncbi:hypothetical protein [Pseudomonas sp.]|uniref:hypothetical protein n=1 Tax=Pseudomonas sp. TaxID=306 RepID=UPI0031DCF129
MTMESTAPLNVSSGADAFAQLFTDTQQEATQEAQEDMREEEATQPEAEAEEATEEAVEAAEEQAEEEPQKFTVKVDGKEVEVTLDELKNGYQRQSDYTRKTQEAAELRKQAETERSQANQEREHYFNNLQRMQVQLESVLEHQSQIDWNKLIDENPVEAVRQQHLLQERQARYQQVMAEQQRVAQQYQAEQAQAQASYLSEQREALLAKLPDWKDDAKAAAEQGAISKFLQEQGFDSAEIQAVTDHRHVLIARDAMRYRDLMANAKAQAKKVQEAPQRVVKPGVGESPNLDRRTTAMKQLGKTGRVEDAAAVFAQFL